MAIKTWIVNGATHYEMSLNLRSKGQKIRKQKQKTGVIFETNPDIVKNHLDRIERILRDETIRTIQVIENDGMLWGELTKRWFTNLNERNEKTAKGEVDRGLVKKLSASCKKNYVQCISDFTEHWMNRPAKSIDPADIETLFESMEKSGYTKSSQYNVKVAISQCFAFGIKRRLIPGLSVSPTVGYGISRRDSKRSEILTFEAIDFLLTEAKRLKHPWAPVWEGAYHTGGRAGEIHELRAKDIHLTEKRGFFQRKYNFVTYQIDELPKDLEWRQFSINDDLYALFIELGVDKMKPDDHVFPRSQAWKYPCQAKILREFCDQIGIPSVCFHTLRACFATHLLRNKVPMTDVMLLGGWSDLKTMKRYIRLAGVEIEGATDSLSIRGKRSPIPLKLVHST